MIRHLIEKGKSYTDKRGNVRLVMRIMVSKMDSDFDMITYRVTERKTLSKHAINSNHTINRRSFAQWARELV
jgi:hypothetical protein